MRLFSAHLPENQFTSFQLVILTILIVMPSAYTHTVRHYFLYVYATIMMTTVIISIILNNDENLDLVMMIIAEVVVLLAAIIITATITMRIVKLEKIQQY